MIFRRPQLGEGWKQCVRGQKGPEPITKLLITILTKRALTNYSPQSRISPWYSSASAEGGGGPHQGWQLQLQGRRFWVGANTCLLCFGKEQTKQIKADRTQLTDRGASTPLLSPHNTAASYFTANGKLRESLLCLKMLMPLDACSQPLDRVQGLRWRS